MASVVPEDDANVPTWRKYQRQQQQLFANAQQNVAANDPISTDRLAKSGYWNNVSSAVDTMGANADAGTQGYIAAQNQRKQDAATAAYQKALQDAQTQFQNAAKQFAGGQASQYASQQPTGTPTASGQQQQVQYSGQQSQVAQMARNAGFPESVIPTVVAISQAESGGRADAQHVNSDRYGSTDLGLMQINDHWHPDLLANGNWQDPQSNMNMAYQIWKDAGSSFSPWSTYNGGQYEKFLSGAQTATQQSYIQPANVPPWSVNTNVGLRTAIVDDVKQYLGLPYVWGGTDLSKGVDCSGLVQSVYKQLGINLPRTADEQSHMGTRTSISNLQPGDLVAWQGGWRGPNYVGHIAVYIGNGQIIEAPHTGADVRVRSLRTDEHPFGVHLTLSNKGVTVPPKVMQTTGHMPADNLPSGSRSDPGPVVYNDPGPRKPPVKHSPGEVIYRNNSSGSSSRQTSSGSARRG